MRRRHPQSGLFQPAIFFFAIIVLLFALASFHDKASSPQVPVASGVHSGEASRRERVTRVYDGDTIKLASGEKVRFIGIDTPELHDNPKLFRDARKLGMDPEKIKDMGVRSYQYTRSLLDGRDVRLEFDAQPRDRYGRLLAYVYLDDGTFVNEAIIRNGYAYPMSIKPNTRHAAEFRALFEEARDRKRGLWKSP